MRRADLPPGEVPGDASPAGEHRGEGRGERRGASAVAAAAALHEPTRRRVYDMVRAQSDPVTRDDVAHALAIGRPTAAFHLDVLARAGLLAVDYARPAGRRGPGAGRPAKRYHASPDDIALSVPERRYDLAGQILAMGVRDAAQAAGDSDPRDTTYAAARRTGEELARSYADVERDAPSRPRVRAVLSELGYEPYDEDDGVRMRNCPFHAVVDVEPELVCHMNLNLVEGLLRGLAVHDVRACLDPRPGECCVRVAQSASADRPADAEAS